MKSHLGRIPARYHQDRLLQNQAMPQLQVQEQDELLSHHYHNQTLVVDLYQVYNSDHNRNRVHVRDSQTLPVYEIDMLQILSCQQGSGPSKLQKRKSRHHHLLQERQVCTFAIKDVGPN